MLRLRLSALAIAGSLLTLSACSRSEEPAEPAAETAAPETTAQPDDNDATPGAEGEPGDGEPGGDEPGGGEDEAGTPAPEPDTAAGDDLTAPEGRVDDLTGQPDLQLERREVDGMQLRLQGGSQLGGPRPGALIGEGLTL